MPYDTAADAEAVRATLSVDNELQPDKVTKRLRVEGVNLVACVPRPPVPSRRPRGETNNARARNLVAIAPGFLEDASLRSLVFPSPDAHTRRSPPRVPPRLSDFAATEPRLLRAAVAAFLDLLNLSTRTLEQFGSVPAAVNRSRRRWIATTSTRRSAGKPRSCTGPSEETIQYYAIKSVDKSQRQRVLQEVQVLRATSHPGVLRFHAWYETQNHLWLILEYCVGGDLLGVLKQDVALPEASVARFAADLCESLRVVHAAGTLHCDLKPSNVLMDEDGRLKLCGFGLARKVADVSASRTNASNATPSALARRGTPCYMAPELFEEGGSHSFASDLYAFGCVLYELAAGKPPFVSASLAELMEMILTEDPPPIEREGGKLAPLSDAFEDLVFALLRKDPTRRATWAEIFAHPFWRSAAVPADVAESVAALANTATPLPRQPAFEARARERARLESPERPASQARTREERPNREKPRGRRGA